MGKRITPEIRDNYGLYTELLNIRKSIVEDVIDISLTKSSNRNYLINLSEIFHSTLTHEIALISEVKKIDYNSFKFQLRCKALSLIPFFRFDSDGATHRNYDESIPLSQQSITTPHFNAFKSTGELIAYKTQELLNEKSRKALEDISLCIVHFFHEANIRLRDHEFSSVTILSKSLPFILKENDPNSGVRFT